MRHRTEATHRPAVLPILRRALFPALLVGLLTGPGASAQVGPPAKDPGTARLLSVFIPGAGHLYAGEPLRGVGMTAASAAALGWGLIGSNVFAWDGTCASGNCINPDEDPDYTQLYVGLGVAGAIWLVSVFDAPRAARRANERTGLLAAVSLHPVGIPADAGPWPGLGITIAF